MMHARCFVLPLASIYIQMPTNQAVTRNILCIACRRM
jgi:hypothetical protein